MTDQLPFHEKDTSPELHGERTLLQTLLWDEEQIYPWNHLAEESASYWGHLDELMATEAPEWGDPPAPSLRERLDQGCHQFYQSLNSIWESFSPAPTTVEPLCAWLINQFGTIVPSTVLEQIGTALSALRSSSAAVADQLIASVQPSLSHWDVEDLLVVARPFAYAMRGAEEQAALDWVLKNATAVDWDNCSDLERARLTLAIARYAIAYRDTPGESLRDQQR